MAEPTERVLTEGTRVEVRNRFDSQWNRGFAIAEVLGDGYRILRTSDDQLLPSVFTAAEIRREPRRGQWWY